MNFTLISVTLSPFSWSAINPAITSSWTCKVPVNISYAFQFTHSLQLIALKTFSKKAHSKSNLKQSIILPFHMLLLWHQQEYLNSEVWSDFQGAQQIQIKDWTQEQLKIHPHPHSSCRLLGKLLNRVWMLAANGKNKFIFDWKLMPKPIIQIGHSEDFHLQTTCILSAVSRRS